MNATNVKNSLTTTINNAVTAGDLAIKPIDITKTVAYLATILQGEEAQALQASKDVATHNTIVKSLGRPT